MKNIITGTMNRIDLIRLLESKGWTIDHVTGSHIVMKHSLACRPMLIVHNKKYNTLGVAIVKNTLRDADASIVEGNRLRAKRA
jgi:predicted RNA binding protein YcfA (HicA-like mRNA interferase family)